MNRPLRKRNKAKFDLLEIDGVKVPAHFSESTQTIIKQVCPILELQFVQARMFARALKSKNTPEGEICGQIQRNFSELNKWMQTDEIGPLVITSCETHMKPRDYAVSILSRRLGYPEATVARYARGMKQ